ncbi:hypothetical protein F5B17DRAFT_112088 [Nemania serpens]|nr:hypothetical protein F5B17DRAFT_112088 [Nemania serpens]
MMAALPIRPTAYNVPKSFKWKTETFSPSSSVPQGMPDISVPDLKGAEGGQTISPSRFFDPLNSPNKTFTATDQLNHLDQVRAVISFYVQNRAVLSKPWLLEIFRVEQKLRNERMNRPTGRPLMNHRRLWSSSWDFQIPEYDPRAFGTWGGTAWQDVIRN